MLRHDDKVYPPRRTVCTCSRQVRVFQFDKLLLRELPRLYNHFKAKQLQLEVREGAPRVGRRRRGGGVDPRLIEKDPFVSLP